jgi:hypothetical protein
MLDQYKRAVLFEAGRGQPKKIALALEKRLFLQGFYKAFHHSGEMVTCERNFALYRAWVP